jgi:hypothetical protein
VVVVVVVSEAVFSNKFYTQLWALFLKFSLRLVSAALPKIL